ncbi:MAG TPA: hypothetical protein VHZ09_08380 [Acidobacteriaceae bacterium]|nr:hypothetical protein [Acidobacteriaceae bacterium]
MNPHIAVHPPASAAKDFAEIMEDFDAHCHERWSLNPGLWHTTTPVRLATRTEQQEFVHDRSMRTPPQVLTDEYAGAPALYGFSEIYFNANHTVALVYATQWCGTLCAERMWVAFAREEGAWKQLSWHATLSIA